MTDLTDPLVPPPHPLPPVRTPHPHVEIDANGRPHVRGTHVPVRRLFAWHRQGTTVETLLRRYRHLGPARLFDALAFAYDHLELMTADLLWERMEQAEIGKIGSQVTSKGRQP